MVGIWRKTREERNIVIIVSKIKIKQISIYFRQKNYAETVTTILEERANSNIIVQFPNLANKYMLMYYQEACYILTNIFSCLKRWTLFYRLLTFSYASLMSCFFNYIWQSFQGLENICFQVAKNSVLNFLMVFFFFFSFY